MPEDTKRAEAAPQPSKKSPMEHRTKVAFIVVILVIVGAIYWSQRQGPKLAGWQTDLPAALARARAESKPLVLFFMAEKQNEATSRMINQALLNGMVVSAVAERRYIPVAVIVDRSLSSAQAKEYQIKLLPTIVVLSANCKELERREGFMGPDQVQQMLFRNSPKL